MTKWKYTVSLNQVGYEDSGYLETEDDNEDDAWDIAYYEYAIHFAEQYFSVCEENEADALEANGEIRYEHFITYDDVNVSIGRVEK